MIETTPGIRAVPIDVSEREPVYAVNASTGRYLRVSQRALLALRMDELGASPAEMADAFAKELRRPVTEEDAAAFCAGVKQRYESLVSASGKSDAAFIFKLPLISKSAITRIGRTFSAAFGIVPAALIIAIAAVGVPLGVQGGRITASADFGAAALAYALFLLSAMMHEFGHASASLRFGSTPNAIGVTVYAMFPAFYTDVTNAWLLKRWQRVVVDLGGSYFQLGVGGLYGIAYALTGAKALHWATLLIVATTVFNLNPIFKFDGYWVVADALGVTNLSATGRHTVRSVLKGRTSELPWPGRIIGFLIAYGAISIGVWLAFTTFMLRALYYHVRSFDHDFTAAFSLTHGVHVNWPLLPPFAFAVGASGVSLVFLCRLLIKAVRLARRGSVPPKGTP